MRVRVAAAAFSIAISTALQISGLGGPAAIAWVLTVLLAAYLLVAHLWARPDRGTARPTAIRQHAWTLGHETVGFIRTRRSGAPREMGPSRTPPLWMPRRNAEQIETGRAYDEDTVAIFWEQFGKALLELVELLRDKELVGAIEARTLTTPSTPGEVERVGHRLIELGSQRKPWSPSTIRRADFPAEEVRRKDSRSPAPGRGGSRA